MYYSLLFQENVKIPRIGRLLSKKMRRNMTVCKILIFELKTYSFFARMVNWATDNYCMMCIESYVTNLVNPHMFRIWFHLEKPLFQLMSFSHSNFAQNAVGDGSIFDMMLLDHLRVNWHIWFLSPTHIPIRICLLVKCSILLIFCPILQDIKTILFPPFIVS